MPRARRALDMSRIDITRGPSAIKVARLRDHLLAIDIAIPRTRIKAQIVLDLLEATRRIAIGPDSRLGYIVRISWVSEVVVRSDSLPFAVRIAAVLAQRDFER